MNKDCRFFRIVLLFFVVTIVGWLLYYPYDEELLVNAVPGNAIFVTRHANLAGRWESIRNHPVAKACLVAAGFATNDVSVVLSDPGLESIVRRAGRRVMLTAYVDRLETSLEPAWVVVGWAGADSLWLRGCLYMRLIEGFQRVGIGMGRHVWFCATGDGSFFSMALVDGVFLGCWSRNPTMVRHLVRLTDTHQDKSTLRERMARPDLSVPGADDRCVITHAYRSGLGRVSGVAGVLQLPRQDYGRFQLRGSVETALLPAGQGLPSTNMYDALAGGELGALLGNAPEILVALPGRVARAAAGNAGWAGMVPWRWLEPGSYITGAVLSGDHSGRLLGIRVPVLFVAVRTRGIDPVDKELPGLIDEINARYDLGLVVTRHPVENWSMYIIDSNRENLYGRMEANEKAGLAVRDGWALLSTSSGALESILTRGGTAGDTVRWINAFRKEESGAIAWADLEGASATLRQATAVYALVMIATMGNRDRETMQWLSTAGSVLQSLGSLGEGCISVASSNGTLSAVLTLGGADENPSK